MSRFAERSTQTELIDEPDIPFSDWETCLHELNTVNTYLGGHTITVDGVKSLIAKNGTTPLTVCEIGCGGGDNLKAISGWHKKSVLKNVPVKYIGIDINKACIDFAAKNCAEIDATFVCSDYRAVEFGNNRPSVIFNSLFCHHFTNEQLVEMLRWMKLNSALGFFINDLQRHPVAYYSIKILTKSFSRSYLVKNDAPISVHRGFHRKEWEALLSKAGINNYTIQWRWAFRFLVIVKNEQ